MPPCQDIVCEQPEATSSLDLTPLWISLALLSTLIVGLGIFYFIKKIQNSSETLVAFVLAGALRISPKPVDAEAGMGSNPSNSQENLPVYYEICPEIPSAPPMIPE